MKRLRRHRVVLVTFASALGFVAACSGDGNDPLPGGTDAGLDNGNNNGGDDGGSIFVPSLDAGVPDSGIAPCEQGTEGCSCEWTPGSFVPLDRGDCEVGLLCVPWDEIPLVDPGLIDEVKTCVQPCDVDADCGANSNGTQRVCRPSGLTEATGAPRICFDEEAEVDEFCGFSRLTASQLPGGVRATPGRMVACPEGTPCQPFGDIDVDEGICLTLCADDGECPESLPYCNPRLFMNASDGSDLGVCSPGPLTVGEVCGSPNPASAGLTTLCDTSSTAVANVACLPGVAVGLDSMPIPPTTQGICTPLCTDESPCQYIDPVLGPTTCSSLYLPVPFGNSQTSGVCGSGCSSFPNTCTGDGVGGAGQFCASADGVSFGDGLDDAIGSAFCVDIVPPTLTPVTIEGGLADLNSGDNCRTLDTTDILSCPRESFCSRLTLSDGRCVFGCSTDAQADPLFCDVVLGTTSTTSTSPVSLCLPFGPNDDAGFCSLP